MKKVIYILTWVLPALCLIFLLSVLVVPRVTGLRLAQVVSGSMEPTIKTGASIAIGPVDPAEIKIGDIIGFKISGIDTPICHRVVGINRTGDDFTFITQGDADKAPDPWLVKQQDVVGKVYFSDSFLLSAARFVSTPLGFILLLILPALIVIVSALRDIRQYKKRQPPVADLAPG